jgi:hypothetical protein
MQDYCERKTQVTFFEKCIHLCSLFPSVPRLNTMTLQTPALTYECRRGKLWAVVKSRLTHDYEQSTIYDRMNSNLCPLAMCRLYSLQNNLKKVLNKYPLEEESNRDASACAPEPSCRVLMSASGAWGALCIHSTEVNRWVFRFRGDDVQRAPLFR